MSRLRLHFHLLATAALAMGVCLSLPVAGVGSNTAWSQEDYAKEEHSHDGEEHVHSAAEHGGATGHAHELAHANAGHALDNPAEWKYDLAIYTFVVFLILLGVLSKFAWGPIVLALEQREGRIEDNIAQAAQRNEEARQMLVSYEAKLASAADEVRGILEEARRDAEHTKDEILAQAKADAKAEHDRLMREVRNAKDAALKEMGEFAANFAVDTAARIIQKQLTPDEHARLVRDAVAGFPSKN